MPLPTTRAERYLYRSAKYRRIAKRMHANRRRVNHFVAGVPVYNRSKTWLNVGDGRKQTPAGLKHGVPTPLVGAGQLPIPGGHLHITAPAQSVLRGVAFHRPAHTPLFTTTHRRTAGTLLFNRRVKYQGKKIGKTPAANRKAKAAGCFACVWRRVHGTLVWPHWDPLLRVPWYDEMLDEVRPTR